MVSKSKSLILVMSLFLCFSLIYAEDFGYGRTISPQTTANYSNITVNNSQYLQGYTPDNFVLKTGDTMSGNLNINSSSPKIFFQEISGELNNLFFSIGEWFTTSERLIIRGGSDDGIYLTTSGDSVGTNYGIYVEDTNDVHINNDFEVLGISYFNGLENYGDTILQNVTADKIYSTNLCYSNGTNCVSNYSNSELLPIITEYRYVNTTQGHIIDIGNWSVLHGSHQIQVFLSVADLGISMASMYYLEVGYLNPNTWRKAIPIASTGGYKISGDNEDIALDVISNGTTMSMRLRRLSGNSNGNVTIKMINLGNVNDVFTSSNSQSINSTDLKTWDVVIEKIELSQGLTNTQRLLLGIHYSGIIDTETKEFIYDSNSSMRNSTTLENPRSVVTWAREGLSGYAYSNIATWKISRYEKSSVNSRTKLTLGLLHNFATTEITDVISFFSNGNISILNALDVPNIATQNLSVTNLTFNNYVDTFKMLNGNLTYDGNLHLIGNLNITGCINYNGGTLGTCV